MEMPLSHMYLDVDNVASVLRSVITATLIGVAVYVVCAAVARLFGGDSGR